VREIRLHGSEGGGTEINRFFLPLSLRDNFGGSTQDAQLLFDSRSVHYELQQAFQIVRRLVRLDV
jgi:hypothetical protein